METKYIYKNIFYLFPYKEITVGERIILYGAGRVGRKYLEQLLVTNYCEVSFVVDKNWKKISKIYKYDVKDVSEVQKVKEKIVIAIDNHTEIYNVKKELLALGIEENRIVSKVYNIPCIENFKSVNPVSKHLNFSLDEIETQYGQDVVNKVEELSLLIRPYSINVPLVRIGRNFDGGYIMADSFRKGGIAYSFGIADDVSWDNDIANKNYEVFMYDYSIDGLPIHRSNFHFFKKGIGGSRNYEIPLDTLENIIISNNHVGFKNMILKMDVEGYEYEIIENTESSVWDKFDQIVIEFHDCLNPSIMFLLVKCLKKLFNTHALIYVHGNNFGDTVKVGDLTLYQYMEMSLSNRKNDLIIAGRNTNSEKCNMDYPNWIELGMIYE